MGSRTKEYHLNLDSRKRVSLTKLLPDLQVTAFKAYREGDRIILEPMVEIPAREMNAYQNTKNYEIIQKGLDEAEIGLIKPLSIDFSTFVDQNV